MGFLKPLNPQFNRNHPLAPGCVAFWPFHETHGDAVDVVGGVRLKPQTSAGRTPTPNGLGGNCNANQTGFAVTTPTSLRLSLPITMACVLRHIGNPTANAVLFAASANNTDATPFVGYEIGVSGSSTFRFSSNSAGTYYGIISAVSANSLAGSFSYLVATFTSARQSLYRNGVEIAFDTTARSSPTYGATSTLGAGFYPAISRNANAQFICGGVWNTAWTQSQVVQFGADPFGLVEPILRRRTYSIPGSSAATGHYYRYLLNRRRVHA